jgi:2-hydroxycyclohexanecarboxyl-CoA dehydrogenase
MSVSDKTAIVTGAGSKRGIGRATAHTLAAAGWNIAILDLDEGSAKDAAQEIAEQRGVQAVGIGCDVTDEASVESALAALDGSVPPVGALVNNAGITSPTPFLEVTGNEWDRIFAVNVRGAYNITRRVAPGMAERGFGASCSWRRSRPSGAAASSAVSPTPRPRPPSSGSPGPWPANSGRTA